MERTLKATVRYDGAGFAGWQVQPDRRTVQGEIERALARIASQPVRIHGAARTDAGVHALGQVFSCRWPKELDPERLRRSLSQMLGLEIRVEHIEEVPPEFHARFSAVSKCYAYTLAFAGEPDPFWARYAWCVPWPMDITRLAELGKRLAGTHDFAGFQCTGSSAETTVRTLYSVEVQPGGIVGPCDARDLCRIEFHGDGFLYKMVRNIVGTMVDIARGKVSEERLDERLASRGPFRGHTAPAHGLTLFEVRYSPDIEKKRAPGYGFSVSTGP
jgi:tRNA pseudouridine38-40 synthase